MRNKNNNNLQTSLLCRAEPGFTLVEAVFAIFILTIGLVGTAAAITYALQYGAISRNVTKAKLLVVASFEEVESLRNARRLDFKQIANDGGVDNTGVANPFTGFSTGFREIPVNPGADGVYGSADDVTSADESKKGFTRRITITSISSSIKKIEVIVRYPGNGNTIGEIRGVSYLNDEARLTR